MKTKYQFGGSTDFFKMIASLANPLNNTQEQTTEYSDTNQEELDFEEQMYTDEDYNSLLESFSELESENEKLKRSAYLNSYNDSFMDFLFSDTSKKPITFLEEDLYPERRASKTPSTSFNPYMTPSSQLTPEGYLNAIFANEGGKTGVNPPIRGNASGRYAIIPSARKDIWNRFYKDSMSYSKFESMYNKDANFEYEVALKLADDKIKTSSTAAEAIASWYYPDYAKKGLWDKVPRPDYGNRLTMRQYVDRAMKNYKQFGGKVLSDTEELKEGLNNPDLDSVILDLPPQYNIIRGLDNGMPIKAIDELGNSEILKGPNDLKIMFGKIQENRL